MIVKFDLVGEFAHFKLPDINSSGASSRTLNLTYDCIHKPCIVGILGCILGLNGFEKINQTPEYWQLFDTKIAIRPNSEYYAKTRLTMVNSVGYANEDGNFIWDEEMLINPNFTIWINCKSEIELKLADMILKGNSEFIPYFGNNTYPAYFHNAEIIEQKQKSDTKIISLVSSVYPKFGRFYPIGYDKILMQYEMKALLSPHLPQNILNKFVNQTCLTYTKDGIIELI